MVWNTILNWVVSPLISALVAVITVGLTFYLQEKRTTVRSLLALKTEAESNREITADGLLLLSLDVVHDQTGSLTPSTLSTESYTVARNNGTISKISNRNRELLSNHYAEIQRANSELAKVHDLWLQEQSLNENDQEHIQETLLSTEQLALEELLVLFDDTENERIDDMGEYISHMNKKVIGSFEYSYEGVIEAVEEELDTIKFSCLFR